AIIEKTGGIDILVNNAGISQRARVVDTEMHVIDRVMQVNFYGAVAMTKAVLPQMIARGNGHIVVISSLVGKFGTPLRSAYAASKHALHGFFDALRAETFNQGIQVTTFCPGYIKTELSYHAMMGDGTTNNQLDKGQANGMAADVFAKKALKAISAGKKEVVIGGKETLGIYFKRFFPNWFFNYVTRINVKDGGR
ncbi:MAG: SDR family NAD(P)-dependent oxidoreductase, partial [Saprospiraceae bacterium]